MLIALLIRGAVCFGSLSSFSSDPDAYRAIAETRSATGVYGVIGADGQPRPTAFRPPLYPYLLSWITTGGKLTNLAVAALHTVLGAITVGFTFLASGRLFAAASRPAIRWVAAVLVAVDPILIQQSTLVMTETLAAALVSVIVWWWADRCQSAGLRGPIGLGVLLALAFLCRPTFLVWAVLLCVALAWLPSSSGRGGGDSRTWLSRFQAGAVVGLIVTATLAAWTMRNWRAVGHPVWATTHGGYTLLLGNNPSFYDYLGDGQWGIPWDPESFFRAYSHRYDGDPNTEAFWRQDWPAPAQIVGRLSEHEDDRVSYDAAVSTIKRRPSTFAWSCAVRTARLWTPIPHHTPDRSWPEVIAIGIYYVLLYLAIAVGLWRLGRQVLGGRWWPIWTLAVTLTLVHTVYWSNIRMRAPLVPGLAIIAAAGLTRKPADPMP
jgi:hypothetical protein